MQEYSIVQTVNHSIGCTKAIELLTEAQLKQVMQRIILYNIVEYIQSSQLPLILLSRPMKRLMHSTEVSNNQQINSWMSNCQAQII
jgi:hypothetical protein